MSSLVEVSSSALITKEEPPNGPSEKQKSTKKRALAPDSTPMRRLEDPLSYQILPSRPSRQTALEDAALMPPPRASGRHKRVLEEDEYTEVLGSIIQRDYFPDLPKLKSQLLWIDALDSNDPEEIERARRVILSEQKKFGLTPTPSRGSPSPSLSSLSSTSRMEREKRGKSSEWDELSPDRQASATAVAGSSSQFEERVMAEQEEEDVTEEERERRRLEAMPLMKFVQTHTSEDNASFNELLAKDQETHRRRYNWAFDSENATENRERRLLLLPSGAGTMNQKQLEAFDAAVAEKTKLGDDRPNGPDTWPHRPKNPLLFPPDLGTNREICGLPKQDEVGAGEDVKLLTEGKSTGSSMPTSSSLTSSSAPSNRVGVIPKAPPATVAKNTRFRGSDLSSSSIPPSPLTLSSSASSVMGGGETDLQRMVAMTPSPMPGAFGSRGSGAEGGASPFVTWGDIEGTPMILDPSSTPLGPLSSSLAREAAGGPQFRIEATSYREKLAERMNQEIAVKKRKRQEAMTGRKRERERNGAPLTPSERIAAMSPAAQNLARRLTGNRFPLPSSSLSRQGGAPRLPGGISSARSVASNVPTPSPFAVGRLNSALREKEGERERIRGRKSGSSVTDNLLPPRP